jgi:hypothetical protein
MSALKKEDIFNEIDALNQFMKSLSNEEKKHLQIGLET